MNKLLVNDLIQQSWNGLRWNSSFREASLGVNGVPRERSEVLDSITNKIWMHESSGERGYQSFALFSDTECNDERKRSERRCVRGRERMGRRTRWRGRREGDIWVAECRRGL